MSGDEPTFTAMAASTGKTMTLSGGGEPRQLRVNEVSAPYFEILGVRPALGRLFAPGEDQQGQEHVIVLSHRIWLSDFGACPRAGPRASIR